MLCVVTLYFGSNTRALISGCRVQLSIFDRALLSLVMSERLTAGVSATDYKTVKNSLNDLFRITARTAYVARQIGQQGPTDSKSQAATMLSVVAAGAQHRQTAYAVLYNPGGNILSDIRKIVPTNPKFFR